MKTARHSPPHPSSPLHPGMTVEGNTMRVSEVLARTLTRSLRPAVPAWERFSRPPQGHEAIRRAQARALAQLVRRLQPTAVGQRFLRKLDSRDAGLVARFQHLVPVMQYADLQPLIERSGTGERDVLFPGVAAARAQTSGTTRDAQAGERYIPLGEDLLAHHRRGGSASLARALDASPEILRGRMLMLGGCAMLDRSGPVPTGDLSGIIANRIPWWIADAYEPGLEIAREPVWERRLGRIAERCRSRDIRLVSGIPAWVLMLFQEQARIAGVQRVQDVWPNLRMLIHGGHSVEPFVPALLDHLSPDTRMLEVYPASEAFIAIGRTPWRLGDRQPSELELLSDHGTFLEFASDDGRVHGAHDLEPGALYRVLVTTPGGLLRYQIGDLVRGVGPGLVRFAGRIKTRLSVFGEHVEGDALTAAIAHAAQRTNAVVAHYHVAPRLPTAGDPRGCHEWLVEFDRLPVSPGGFITAIDDHLSQHVIDYVAHRDGGQLTAPHLFALPTGTFHRYLAAKGHLGGQHKVPQAWPDRTIAEALLAFARGGAEERRSGPPPG